jgi:hypothetical protein
MCYASPGPRCSSHARADLKSAQSAEASALTLLEAASNLVQRLNTRLGDTLDANHADKRERERQEDDYGRHLDDYWRAKENLIRAREVYETTPEGIAGLKDELVARQQHLDGAIEDDADYQDLAHRLHVGQETRARQLAAYKATHGANAPEPDGGLEDEEEAAAAPPPCTCIEYRYQSTCAHVANKVAHTRRRLLPTSNEAALDAHAAAATFRLRQNEARTIAATPRARTALVRGMGPVPEQREADDAVAQAWADMQRTQATFYTTPAGQAFIEAKIHVAHRGPVYLADEASPTGFRLSNWNEVYVEAQRTRVRNEQEYHALLAATPHTATAEDANDVTQRLEDANTETHTPPDLLYANPCPQRCTDFQWVGDCSHLGEHPAAFGPPASTNTTPPGSNGPATGTGDGPSTTTSPTSLGKHVAEAVTDAVAGAVAPLIDTPEPAGIPKPPTIVDRILGRW